jgi:membrane-associated phospholipid phosphatase
MKRPEENPDEAAKFASADLEATPNPTIIYSEITDGSTDETDIESNNIISSFKTFDEISTNDEKTVLWPLISALYRLDQFDKYYSSKLQNHKSLTADLLLTLPAHLFNRIEITISILLSLIVGSLTYN